MLDWKILAVVTPLLFVTYQSVAKLIPKDISLFLVNGYASLTTLILMIILHLIFSPNKSLSLQNSKYLIIAISIGILVGLGNFGIIKIFNLGASQSLFSLIFYSAIIIYGVIFGFLIWHERLVALQILGMLITIIGLFMTVYFKK